MGDYKFAKDKLADVLTGLKEYQVFAPAAVGDVLRFKEVADPADVSLDYDNTTVPPKELMFPQTETLFKYRLGSTRDRAVGAGSRRKEDSVRDKAVRRAGLHHRGQPLRVGLPGPLLPEAPRGHRPRRARLRGPLRQLLLPVGRRCAPLQRRGWTR